MNNDTIGVVADTSPHDLPLNAWSNSRNMRVIDSKMEKTAGQATAFAPGVDPHFLLPCRTPAGFFWLYAGANKIRKYKAPTDSDATRLSDGATYADWVPQNSWTGGILNGIPVLNRPSDFPQAWANPGVAANVQNLPFWPLAWRARSLRPFGPFLVALMDISSTPANPYLVQWSHPAVPGALPASWDSANPTLDAGSVALATTDGFLVDQCTLGKANIIYKDDSAYIQQFIGGNDIFSFDPILKSGGILSVNCVQEFESKGAKHIVLGPHDLYVHDGRNSESVIRGRLKKWLFSNLSDEGAVNSFISHNLDQTEMWICFPEIGKIQPNLAIVWNYKDNTLMVRDLPNVSCGALGDLTILGSTTDDDSWDLDNESWDSDISPWGFSNFSPTGQKLMLGAPAASGVAARMHMMEQGTTFNGGVFQSFVERIGLTVVGQDKVTGKPIEDTEVVKLLTEIWPRLEGDVGTRIDVYAGVQDSRDKSPSWEGPFPYIIGEDTKVNPLVSGKILSVRFEATTAASWSISGYDLNIEPVGGY